MSGPECCSNAPILNPTSGVGHVEKLGDLATYVTGFEAPNLRKLADKVAAKGYYVVVPDFLYGDPFNPEDATRPLPVWLKDHPSNNGFEEAKQVIDALKHKGVLSIGAASFCWGGINIPIAILGAEIDKYCPPELLKQFKQLLTAELEVDCYVKVFPNVSHGWTIRYNIEDAMAIKAAAEAHQSLLDWFAKHVK